MKDAYALILAAIEAGTYRPGDRLVESELAERFGVSRTPVREALQRLETQAMLIRDGRSLIVAALDHDQLAELYTVRAELEALAAQLAARHATPEEVRLLHGWLTGGGTRLVLSTQPWEEPARGAGSWAEWARRARPVEVAVD